METRKVSCEVVKTVADKIKDWAIAHNVDCFRSECFDKIYVEMKLDEKQIYEVNALIDKAYKEIEKMEVVA